MRRESKHRVLQILPADGWSVVYSSLEDGTPFAEPLVCWALVDFTDTDEDKHDFFPVVTWARQAIVGVTTGLDGWVSSPEDDSNFIGYLRAGEDLSIWTERAREHFESEQKRRGVKP